MIQSGNRIQCFFQRLRDRHQHLINGIDTHVRSHHNAREIRAREYGYWNGFCQVNADRHQRKNRENDRLPVARSPMHGFLFNARLRRRKVAHFGFA